VSRLLKVISYAKADCISLAFGSRTAGEDSERMARIQDRIGLTAKVSGTALGRTEDFNKGEVSHSEKEIHGADVL